MAISRCSFDFLEAVSAVQNSERLKAVANRLLFFAVWPLNKDVLQN
jgi:hypothetical protein